jgi:hypothetical protein
MVSGGGMSADHLWHLLDEGSVRIGTSSLLCRAS